MAYFRIALAEPLRHHDPSEIADDLARAKAKGYTGIWIEPDYVRWDKFELQGHPEFSPHWAILDIFDFTLGKERDRYAKYLRQLCGLCAHTGLDVYVSFWMPRVKAEFLDYLRKNHPDAIGRTNSFAQNGVPCLCTCEDGEGLRVLGSMVEQFLREFPQVRGLKIGTEDNHALNCEPDCPHAHGTSRARHTANMFACVQQAMLRVRRDAHFLLYPWFWREGYAEEILPRLQDGFFIVTKMESGATQALEEQTPGEPLFDSSFVADRPGPAFLDWIKRVGPDRIMDMVPVGTGIDDFFLANPPYPGRIYRRFKHLQNHGVRRFLDFECGGHCPGSGEEAVALFHSKPNLTGDEFLAALAASMYSNPRARESAVAGWKAFDQGFGKLPIGLGNTGHPIFSGRFGFAWSMCIATPLVKSAFGDERGHAVHWFSPYNFFNRRLASRLELQFLRVLSCWQESTRHLAVADAVEGRATASQREAVSAEAHVMSVTSALQWCLGAKIAAAESDEPGGFRDLARAEILLTERFAALVNAHPWVWANNYWHPHLTPLSQKGIGFEGMNHHDTFRAKLAIMKAKLAT